MLMKIITALFGIMLVMLPWQAQSGEKERLELATVLVEKARVSEMFVDLAAAFMETYFERFDKAGVEDPAAGNPLRKIFKEEASLGEEELKLMLAEIYAAQFTEDELKEIVTFFKSSAGSAWLDRRLMLETECEQVGLEWGQLLTRRVLKKYEDQSGEKF
jgi:hypothetical protein